VAEAVEVPTPGIGERIGNPFGIKLSSRRPCE
jgi:hypothetical protein